MGGRWADIRAAGAAEPLEIGRALLELASGQPADHGHHLAVPPAAIAKDAYHAVVRKGWGGRDRPLSGDWRANAPGLRGVHAT
jgi:hypothetical protein